MSAASPLVRVRRATARRSRSEDEWRLAIREAVAAGISTRTIASEAGVTHVRVFQIARGE